MQQRDIEVGGSWYWVRVELEEICRQAGRPCIMKPFNERRGPYAVIGNNERLWSILGDVDDQKYMYDGKDVIILRFKEMVEFLK